MYDELVKDLRENHDKYFARDMQAADAIEELQATVEGYKSSTNMVFVEKDGETVIEFVPRWIPVTERLPEEVRKSYLCRTDSGYHCEVRWTDNVYGLWTGGGGKWGWSIFDIPQYAKVTHWMPLPPAPKEESNGV